MMHPVANQVISCNFLRYWPGRVLSVPISPINEELSVALKRGAFILKQNRFAKITVEEGAPIPEKIELECEGLLLKDKIRRSRLILPDGCSWAKDVTESFLVGSVYGRAKTAGAEP